MQWGGKRVEVCRLVVVALVLVLVLVSGWVTMVWFGGESMREESS
jgi:hypothetical protein